MFSYLREPSGKFFLALFLFLASPAFAQSEPEPMSEADLRSILPFGQDDTLKYTGCEMKTYPTCTYVWGIPAGDDDARVKLGAKPEGDKLLTIFAQAHSLQDFDRVLAVYPDAEPVDGLGITAVWSASRHQLSFMSADYLVIHVNVDAPNVADRKAIAIQIATFLSLAGG